MLSDNASQHLQELEAMKKEHEMQLHATANEQNTDLKATEVNIKTQIEQIRRECAAELQI